MASLYSYALTTVADVKETMGIDAGDSSKNNLIIRKINQATDYIESFCNLSRDHHFKETTYTNEEYDTLMADQIALRMRPVSAITSFQARNGVSNIDSWDDVDSELVFNDLSSGVIDLNYITSSGWNSFRVTYTAGYATIPADLAEAAATLAAYWVENSTSGTNVKRKREGQRELEYFQLGGDAGKSIIENLGLDDILSRYINYVLLDV